MNTSCKLLLAGFALLISGFGQTPPAGGYTLADLPAIATYYTAKYTLADLPAIATYYTANGAPVPSLHQNTELYPTGSYVWNELRFDFGSGKEYSLQLELVLANPQVGLCDLVHAKYIRPELNGICVGLPQYTPPAAAAVVSTPIDDVVGIPDTGHAGLFEPGPKASMQLFIGLSAAGVNYTAKNGKQYRPVLINPGSMFATYDWALVQ